MVGLGRMGANMAERLSRAGIDVKTYDTQVESTAGSLEELVGQLEAPRSVWLMVPAAIVDTRRPPGQAAPGGGRCGGRRREFVLRGRFAPGG